MGDLQAKPLPSLLALPCPTAGFPVSNTDKEAEGKWRGMFRKSTAALSYVCREGGLLPTNTLAHGTCWQTRITHAVNFT